MYPLERELGSKIAELKTIEAGFQIKIEILNSEIQRLNQ
jgi:hypothetical protein